MELRNTVLGSCEARKERGKHLQCFVSTGEKIEPNNKRNLQQSMLPKSELCMRTSVYQPMNGQLWVTYN